MTKKHIILLFLLTIISCTSSQKTTSNSNNNKNKNSSSNSYITVDTNKKLNELKKNQDIMLSTGSSKDIDTVHLQNNLLYFFKQWEGTPYKLGGNSKAGIDCSGFVQQIYKNVLNYDVPRTSNEQANLSKKINKSDLKTGDILYFTPGGNGSHTAVYLGNSLFLNASTSKGVVLSSLDETYWDKYFKHGVRVKN